MTDPFIDQIVSLTNAERAKWGLAPLTIEVQLNQAAQKHSADMAYGDQFSHTGVDGSTPWTRIEASGYQYQAAAENIAAGYSTPATVVASWMNSPGHRANILNPNVRNIGVGHVFLANDTGNVNFNHYWTQVFGTRLPGTEPERSLPSPAPEPPRVSSDSAVGNEATQSSDNNAVSSNASNDVNIDAGGGDNVNVDDVSTNNTDGETLPGPDPSLVEGARQRDNGGRDVAADNSVDSNAELPSARPDEGSDRREAADVFNEAVRYDSVGNEATLDGSNQDERSTGSLNNNTILAGSGDDLLVGGLGDDRLFGKQGNDVLRGDLNVAQSGGTIGGDDLLQGGEGHDRIGGKAGDDRLLGGSGNDQLWGDDGDDILQGGLGNDTLTGDDFSGGSGRDIFVLTPGEGIDTIVDFQMGIDLIGLTEELEIGSLSVTTQASNTLISLGEDVLAILSGVSGLSESMFTAISNITGL